MNSSNPKDVIRYHILKTLYEIAQKSRSAKSVAVGTRELEQNMRDAYSYKQQDIAGNLDYLIDKGYVREVVQNRSFQSKGGAVYSSEKHLYKISSAGVDYLEKQSLFQHPPLAPHVNITNISGVVTVGDRNVVNVKFAEIAPLLDQLRKELGTDNALSDEQRLNVLSDLDSLSAQIQKPSPNWNLIGTLWESVKAVAAVGGATEFALRISHLLSSLK